MDGGTPTPRAGSGGMVGAAGAGGGIVTPQAGRMGSESGAGGIPPADAGPRDGGPSCDEDDPETADDCDGGGILGQ